jgi:membrane protein implicated in regulation of membrane protease activity
VAVVTLAVLCVSVPAGSFRAYPLVRMPLSPATFALCAALVVVTLAPFVDRRGIDP